MSQLKKKAQTLIGALRGHKLPEGAAAAVDELEQHLNGVDDTSDAPPAEAGPEGEEVAADTKVKSKKKKKKGAEAPADEVKP